MNTIDRSRLDRVIEDLYALKHDIAWEGYDPDRPTPEEAIGTLCDTLAEALNIIRSS